MSKSVVVETDVGRLVWMPLDTACKLLTTESTEEGVKILQVSSFMKMREILRGTLPSLITETLAAEAGIKEHLRLVQENALAIETARRKGFLAM